MLQNMPNLSPSPLVDHRNNASTTGCATAYSNGNKVGTSVASGNAAKTASALSLEMHRTTTEVSTQQHPYFPPRQLIRVTAQGLSQPKTLHVALSRRLRSDGRFMRVASSSVRSTAPCSWNGFGSSNLRAYCLFRKIVRFYHHDESSPPWLFGYTSTSCTVLFTLAGIAGCMPNPTAPLRPVQTGGYLENSPSPFSTTAAFAKRLLTSTTRTIPTLCFTSYVMVMVCPSDMNPNSYM